MRWKLLIIIIIGGILGLIFYNPIKNTMTMENLKQVFAQDKIHEAGVPIKNSLGTATIDTTKGWIVKKMTGNEYNFKIIIADIQDKKTDICFVLKEGVNISKVDLSPKQLYNKDGTLILDNKGKEITLKYETNKCLNKTKDGYHILLIDAQAVNIKDYIQFGNKTIILVYQDEKRIHYVYSFGEANITLYKDGYPINNISVHYNPTNLKFGAIDNYTGNSTLNSYTYILNSTNKLNKDISFKKVSGKILNSTNFYVYKKINGTEIKQYFSFNDICLKNYSNCSYILNNNSAIINFKSYKLIDPNIYNMTGCQTLDEDGAVYNLMNDTNYVYSSCFLVTANNIVLEGNNHIITGSNLGIGVYVYTDIINNITIKNLNIVNFVYGVFNGAYVTNSTYDNITITGSSITGMSANTGLNNHYNNIQSYNNGHNLIVSEGRKNFFSYYNSFGRIDWTDDRSNKSYCNDVYCDSSKTECEQTGCSSTWRNGICNDHNYTCTYNQNTCENPLGCASTWNSQHCENDVWGICDTSTLCTNPLGCNTAWNSGFCDNELCSTEETCNAPLNCESTWNNGNCDGADYECCNQEGYNCDNREDCEDCGGTYTGHCEGGNTECCNQEGYNCDSNPSQCEECGGSSYDNWCSDPICIDDQTRCEDPLNACNSAWHNCCSSTWWTADCENPSCNNEADCTATSDYCDDGNCYDQESCEGDPCYSTWHTTCSSVWHSIDECGDPSCDNQGACECSDSYCEDGRCLSQTPCETFACNSNWNAEYCNNPVCTNQSTCQAPWGCGSTWIYTETCNDARCTNQSSCVATYGCASIWNSINFCDNGNCLTQAVCERLGCSSSWVFNTSSYSGFLCDMSIENNYQNDPKLDFNHIIISNNSIFLNATYYAGLKINSSANLTFYGLNTTMANPFMARNGVKCNDTTNPLCLNYTSLNAGNVKINVSSWTNYSIQDEGGGVISCIQLIGDNLVITCNCTVTSNYSFAGDLISNGTGIISLFGKLTPNSTNQHSYFYPACEWNIYPGGGIY